MENNTKTPEGILDRKGIGEPSHTQQLIMEAYTYGENKEPLLDEDKGEIYSYDEKPRDFNNGKTSNR